MIHTNMHELMLLRRWSRGASRREARATSKYRCGWEMVGFCKNTFKESVRRVAAQITTQQMSLWLWK